MIKLKLATISFAPTPHININSLLTPLQYNTMKQ